MITMISWLHVNIVACILITGLQAASPSIPLCLETNQIAWKVYPPYLNETLDYNNSGIVSDMFKIALRSCCRGDIHFQHNVEFFKQTEAAQLTMNHSIDFIMPIQIDVKSKKYLHKLFVSVVDSPGFVLYVVPNPSPGEAIIKAISSTWPLIIMMFMMVAISGTLFCLIETMILKNKFREQIGEGIWWAFVSMTTVGYGDICPKTKCGKLFSIVWVLTGVACCALFTSYITTILTSACLNVEVSLSNMKVAVIQGTEEHKYALKKNSIPTGFQNVEEIIEALDVRKVQGALIDSYVAAGYQHALNRYRLQSIIEHVTSNGIVFQNKGSKFGACVRDYLLSRQGDVFDMISKRVQPIKMSMLSSAEEKSKNLLDPSSTTFQISIIGMAIGLATIITTGTLWEKGKNHRQKKVEREKKLEHEDNTDYMTLTEWRQSYKSNLREIIKSIQRDTEILQAKCSAVTTKLALQNNGLVTLQSSYTPPGKMVTFRDNV